MTLPTVLVVTADPVLLEEVSVACAAAQASTVTVGSWEGAVLGWPTAQVVVVGADRVPDAPTWSLPRRDRVVVVAPGEPAADLWRGAVGLGAERVLGLPADAAALAQGLVAAPPDDGACMIGVVGGRGGAGASVLAGLMARSSAAGGRATLLVDADPDGTGLDILLGLEDAAGARWSALAGLDEALPPQTLRAALPMVDGLAVLAPDRQRGGVPAPAVLARVLDSARAAYDVVVVDLPRARDDLLACVAPRCSEVLVVVPSDVCGTAAAARTVARVRGLAPVRLVVRFLPGSSLLPEEMAEWLGVAAAAELPHDGRLVAALDRGEGPSPRSRLARTVRDLTISMLAPGHGWAM